MANKKESVDINNTINVIQAVELLCCYFAFCIFFFCNWLGHGIIHTLKSIVMIIPNLLWSIPSTVINIYKCATVEGTSFQLGTCLVAILVILNVVGFIFARVHKE